MLNSLPQNPVPTAGTFQDVLSSLLASIRLSGSLQFCLTASGHWQADSVSLKDMIRSPATTMPFHVMAEGRCWLRIDGEEAVMEAGDIVAFPFCSSHQIGNGIGGEMIDPGADLPQKPWQEIPVLRYGAASPEMKILCGFVQCDALDFLPLRTSLPKLIHIRTARTDEASWLQATVRQMAEEVDSPRLGGVSMVPRLTEIMFIEILRTQMMARMPKTVGWLAALADACMSRCLSLIHADPQRDWSLEELALAAQTSRTALAERFQAFLDTSPMKYLRDWRLHLASVALTTTQRPVAAIAYESRYGTEAAFTRAFKRAFGHPPAAWRRMRSSDR